VRVEPFAPPRNGAGVCILWAGGTGGPSGLTIKASATILFLAAAAATLGIGFREPRLDYGYECVLFILAAFWCRGAPSRSMALIPASALASISAWGFVQLALGATVYRHATMGASLRFAALGATAWVSFRVLATHRLRVEFLRAFAWFGVLVAAISVLAFFTSPGKIFWMFDAPYPDVWGSFLSRNNFAQFLELAMPVALWFALREAGSALYLCFAAIMLASGLASASRAGALILVLEAIVILWMRRKSPPARRMTLGLIFATGLFAALAGIGTLAVRLTASDPFQVRREIVHSTVAMISSRPWTGFGLGTFPVVYPEYALFDVGKSVEHAHNDWLEWAAEGGIGFAALWVGLALCFARIAVLTGWGIGVLGCFVHGLVDYPFARFGVSAWVLILLGILAATDLREVRSRMH
jgi:O-antigen ligase